MNQRIGGAFPDLELLDHSLDRVRISEIAGKFPLALIFYRGFW